MDTLQTRLVLSSPENPQADDPIPKVFAYFCQQAEKSDRYRLTAKRRRMASRRWNEEVSAARKRGIKRERIRGEVGNIFKHVIDELCESKFHRENGYVEWEQLFASEDRFNKWIDRYENNYAEQHNKAHP